MKKKLSLLVAFGVGLSILSTHAISSVEAKGNVMFKDCKAMNKVYKGGVAESKKWKNKGGELKYTKHLVVNKSVYLANKKKDRDKDGLVCER